MALDTVIATGAWGDFSVKTKQTMGTLSQAPAVGDRIFLVIGSTVAANVSPGASTWGGIVSMYDNQGNVFTRDTPTAALATGDNTTCEIWSAYVHYAIPTTGYYLNITPDSRGLSAYWKLIDVSGLGEATDGSTSPVDQVAQADESSTTSFVSGTTGTLATSDTWCLAAFSVAGAPTSPWATDTGGFTRVGSDQSGSGPGSSRGLSVWAKTVSATTGVSETVTIGSAFSGAGVIATYKIASSTPDTSGIRPVVSTSKQTASGTSLTTTAIDTTGCDLLIVLAPTWHSSGQTSTIADSKSNTWHALTTTVPATGGLAKMYGWYAWNPTVGTSHTVTVTSSKSASEITIEFDGFSGSQTGSDPKDQSNSHTATATGATPGSVTVSTAGELYVVAFTEDAGTTAINTSGWVQPTDIAANQDLHSQWQVHAAQTVNPTVTMGTSTSYAGIIATFKPAAGSNKSIAPATIAATSSFSATVVRKRALPLGTIAATSTFSGGIVRKHPLPLASITATSTFSGAIGRGRPLPLASITATSDFSNGIGTTSGSSLVLAAIHATSSLSAGVVRGRSLPAAILATSTLSGALVRKASLPAAAIVATSPMTGAASGGSGGGTRTLAPSIALTIAPSLAPVIGGRQLN